MGRCMGKRISEYTREYSTGIISESADVQNTKLRNERYSAGIISESADVQDIGLRNGR